MIFDPNCVPTVFLVGTPGLMVKNKGESAAPGPALAETLRETLAPSASAASFLC